MIVSSARILRSGSCLRRLLRRDSGLELARKRESQGTPHYIRDMPEPIANASQPSALGLLRLPHLLFELDGTLTNPFEGISRCLLHALGTLGHDAVSAESLRVCIGPPLRSTLAMLMNTT